MAGCAARFPHEWLPEPQDIARWPFGAAVEVWTGPEKAPSFKGELIAVTDDTLHVLTPEGFRSVARSNVKEVQSQADVSGRLHSPQLRFHRDSWAMSGDPKRWYELRPYSRFPGGMPDSLDRSSLRMPDAAHERAQWRSSMDKKKKKGESTK